MTTHMTSTRSPAGVAPDTATTGTDTSGRGNDKPATSIHHGHVVTWMSPDDHDLAGRTVVLDLGQRGPDPWCLTVDHTMVGATHLTLVGDATQGDRVWRDHHHLMPKHAKVPVIVTDDTDDADASVVDDPRIDDGDDWIIAHRPDGSAVSLFLDDDRRLVLSTVDGDAIFGATQTWRHGDGIKPKPTDATFDGWADAVHVARSFARQIVIGTNPVVAMTVGTDHGTLVWSLDQAGADGLPPLADAATNADAAATRQRKATTGFIVPGVGVRQFSWTPDDALQLVAPLDGDDGRVVDTVRSSNPFLALDPGIARVKSMIHAWDAAGALAAAMDGTKDRVVVVDPANDDQVLIVRTT